MGYKAGPQHDKAVVPPKKLSYQARKKKEREEAESDQLLHLSKLCSSANDVTNDAMDVNTQSPVVRPLLRVREAPSSTRRVKDPNNLLSKGNYLSDSSAAAGGACNRATAAGGGGRRGSSLTIDTIPEDMVLSIRDIKMDDNLHHNADEQHDIEAAVVVPEGHIRNQQGNENERTSISSSNMSMDTVEASKMISTWANTMGYSNNDNDHNEKTHRPSIARQNGFRRTVMNPQFPERIKIGQATRSEKKLLKQYNPQVKWLQYSLFTVWAFILMIIFGSGGWAFPDGTPSCSDKEPTTHNASLCGVVDVLVAGNLSLRFLTSFILGGFVLSTRNLWLARRTAYCAVCGATRNLLINVTTLTPEKDRRLLARWAVLGYELSVLKARSLIDSKEGEKYLSSSNLIVEDEWNSMVDGDRHTTVWYWIQSKAMQLEDRGEIDSFKLQTICNAITLSRDKANDLMSCIDRDQPPPYVFVCGILVNVNLWIQSTANGLVWATWMNDAPGLQIFTEPRLYCDMIILYLATSIFAMLFDVCSLMYNPFGPRPFDIRHDVVGSGIRHLGISLSATGGSVPSTIDNSTAHDGSQFSRTITSAAERDTIMKGTYSNRHSLLPSLNVRRRDITTNDRNTILPSLHFRGRTTNSAGRNNA